MGVRCASGRAPAKGEDVTYTLIAVVASGGSVGELDRQTFDTIEAAEARMAEWGKYGVDGFCDEPSEVGIFDAEGTLVRQWHWRRRQPFDPREVAPDEPGAA
jgi:hypothetical protein